MNSIFRPYIGLFLLCLAPGLSYAHEPEIIFNKVVLQANAESEIANDEMRVILVTEHQGRNPADLAEEINGDMEWALDKAKKYRELNVSTRSYRTNPVYKDRIITAWHASQELELTGTDFSDLTTLVGDLQERLQVRQMTFNPTTASRKSAEDGLIADAVQAFKARIEIVKSQMDEKDYRIIDMNIHTNNQMMPPVRYAQQAEMSVMSRAAPVAEAGTSKIVVTVSGSVQFY